MTPRRLAVLLAALAALALAGCGGSSSSGGLNGPHIGAASTFGLSRFQPAGPVRPGRPTTVSFAIRQPSGRILTTYKHGAGPHNGIHLILVRSDLSAIIHHHPPVAADGTVRDTVTFPSPGRWHVLVDAYPKLPGSLANFQLVHTITVKGAYHARSLPAPRTVDVVHGYRIAMQGHPRFKAITPQFVTFTVRRPNGTPAPFTPWYGALAHAIFFRRQGLDYFHTHVCGANAPNCASVVGGAKVTGHSTTPGRLQVGILLPLGGTWRLFLQCQVDGRILTAPFTLKVAP